MGSPDREGGAANTASAAVRLDVVALKSLPAVCAPGAGAWLLRPATAAPAG
jgi:hypothetical protein